MKQVRTLIAGIILGLLPGPWFGLNPGKDHPIFSNPLAQPTVRGNLEQTAETLVEKSGKAMQKGAKALQKKIEGPLLF